MRRDWFSCPATVAVAVAVISSMKPVLVDAAPLFPAASVASGEPVRLLAQAPPLPPPMATDSAVAASAENAATTETAADSTAASTNGGVPVDPSTAPGDDALPAAGNATGLRVAELLPPDDALPTVQELSNNPYLVQQADESGLFSGELSGAYVPPPAPATPEEKARAAGAEMLNILGAEIYNRRVNITTPPDTEVGEVVRLLAERAGLNFVYGEGVISGRVTLNLRDVPLGSALQSLLATQNLVLIREGENVMRIAARSAGGHQTVETRTIYIKLNWVPAPSLVTAITSVLKQGQITAQGESNTLIVTDVPSNLQVVRDLVTQLDVPDKQVMIEARMVEMLINYNKGQGSSTIIETEDKSNRSLATGVLNGNIGQSVDRFASSLFNSTASPTISFGGVANIFGKEYNISAALDALEIRRVVNVLACPRVITLNNQEAFIDIKREIPYLEAQTGVTAGIIQVTVKFKDAGVSLRAVPNITNSGYVRMRLEPEQRILAGQVQGSQGQIPVIDRRMAITNVIVKDEDTVVLAGLREVDSNDARSQVPFLGQAPVFGWFFKNSSKGHLKNDLMLFVTPHIIKAPVLTPAENYKYRQVDKHWDLPDFFYDDSVENRENRHRYEMDHDSNSYYPTPLRLPPPVPPAPAAPGAPVEGDEVAAAVTTEGEVTK